MRHLSLAALALFTAVRLAADNNPAPTLSANSINPPFAAATLNDPFPDAVYGADHDGSTFTLTQSYLSPFGNIDHSRGVITYQCAPFVPRNSEGVYGIDVWLEQQDGSGSWGPASLNGGLADNHASAYQPVNTPNPGPSPSYTFSWTFDSERLPPNTSFRIFTYTYLYNQGGGSQGNFYAASTIGTVNTGASNDSPRIAWNPSSNAINPTQVLAGQNYTISANAQDDNGNLAAVSINKNGQPFAYAGGGDGNEGTSGNPSSDPPGNVVYTAWATDSYGAQSPTITWTVTIAKGSQNPVSSANATQAYYSQAFTPAYAGGSGSGAWQFVVGGSTNWTGGNDGNAGTELAPSNTWSPSWDPPAPGSYAFWVARDGDATYYPSGASSAYTLTVTPAAPVGSFDGVTPATVTKGQTLTGSGWAADAQSGAPLSRVQLSVDHGVGGAIGAVLGGSRPDVQSANANGGHWSPLSLGSSGWSFSFSTAGLSPGSHTVSAIAYDTPYGVSAALGSKSFTVAAAAIPTISLSAPASGTYGTAFALSATASEGSFPLQSVEINASWTGYGTNESLVAVSSSPSNPTCTLGAAFTPGQTGTLYLRAFATDTQGATANAYAAVTVGKAAQAPVTIAPSQSTVTPGTSITFTASGGSGTGPYDWSGSASGTGSSTAVTFPSAGTYTVTVTKAGDSNYLPSAPASASVGVVLPEYTLSTYAVGSGSVTPGGNYPANSLVSVTATPGTNALFTGWTGSLSSSSNPLTVSMTGNLLLYGNFTTPATPAPPSPPVSPPPSPPSPPAPPAPTAIARIRFNASGNDAQIAPLRLLPGTSILWTDPTGLLSSPWPSFTNPATASPTLGAFPLPAVPTGN